MRGLLMGRIAGALGVDAWAAHSAGLFEECGKAVMFRHATERYKPLLARSRRPTKSCCCSSTPSSASATTRSARRCARAGASRRRRSTACAITSSSTARSSCRCTCRGAAICAISALAHALMTDPDTLDDVARKVAPQAELDPTAGAARRAPGAGADRDGGRAREDRLSRSRVFSRPSRPRPSPPPPTSSSRRR